MRTEEGLRALADDLYQLTLPLPFALNSVNVYLLRGEKGWTILDCGLHTQQAAKTWARARATLRIQAADIEQIVLTHSHPDHYGMAGLIQAEAAASGQKVPVHLSVEEAAFAELLWKNPQAHDRMRPHLLKGGMPEEHIRIVAGAEDFTRQHTHPQANFGAFIAPGSCWRLGRRDCRVLAAYGHSEGQIIFYHEAERLLFCGDHVLMKITPNIGLWPNSRPDPLGRYLASLREMRSLNVRLALPGHRAPITNWRGRIDELLEHHEKRLEETSRACERPSSAYQVAERIFDSRRFSAHEWRFAMVEALAHLEYLHRRGQLRQRGESVWLYERIG